jgi:hypothetical protein
MSMPRRLIVVVAAIVGLSAATARGVAAEEAKGLLAGLPSEPGPHIENIKALPENGWLNLGSPAAGPKWGKGRGRSWSAR